MTILPKEEICWRLVLEGGYVEARDIWRTMQAIPYVGVHFWFHHHQHHHHLVTSEGRSGSADLANNACNVNDIVVVGGGGARNSCWVPLHELFRQEGYTGDSWLETLEHVQIWDSHLCHLRDELILDVIDLLPDGKDETLHGGVMLRNNNNNSLKLLHKEFCQRELNQAISNYIETLCEIENWYMKLPMADQTYAFQFRIKSQRSNSLDVSSQNLLTRKRSFHQVPLSENDCVERQLLEIPLGSFMRANSHITCHLLQSTEENPTPSNCCIGTHLSFQVPTPTSNQDGIIIPDSYVVPPIFVTAAIHEASPQTLYVKLLSDVFYGAEEGVRSLADVKDMLQKHSIRPEWLPQVVIRNWYERSNNPPSETTNEPGERVNHGYLPHAVAQDILAIWQAWPTSNPTIATKAQAYQRLFEERFVAGYPTVFGVKGSNYYETPPEWEVLEVDDEDIYEWSIIVGLAQQYRERSALEQNLKDLCKKIYGEDLLK